MDLRFEGTKYPPESGTDCGHVPLSDASEIAKGTIGTGTRLHQQVVSSCCINTNNIQQPTTHLHLQPPSPLPTISKQQPQQQEPEHHAARPNHSCGAESKRAKWTGPFDENQVARNKDAGNLREHQGSTSTKSFSKRTQLAALEKTSRATKSLKTLSQSEFGEKMCFAATFYRWQRLT